MKPPTALTLEVSHRHHKVMPGNPSLAAGLAVPGHIGQDKDIIPQPIVTPVSPKAL
jgi:hypothetical protein